ncbi:Mfap5 [Columba guinea]|nr:Mfap5 [Columba guinea]
MRDEDLWSPYTVVSLSTLLVLSCLVSMDGQWARTGKCNWKGQSRLAYQGSLKLFALQKTDSSSMVFPLPCDSAHLLVRVLWVKLTSCHGTTLEEKSESTILYMQVQSDSETTTASSDCREEKFPCTRLYSVHKPVKQCISYLCVTSVRRMYIINKEVCTRIVCKENEVMQDEICRQLAGLSPRLRRSGQPMHLPCRKLLEQQLKRPDAL